MDTNSKAVMVSKRRGPYRHHPLALKRAIVYGVGFCGITDETGRIVQPGDFDEARRLRQE